MKKIIFILLTLIITLAVICIFNAARLKSLQSKTGAEVDQTATISDAVIDKLSQAIKIQSISYDQPEKFQSENFLELTSFLKKQFPLSTKNLSPEIINKYSMLYTWKGSDATLKPVLFLAHLDVVPIEAGTEGDWKYPPFEGRIAEGYVWGRGAIDDKVNVISLLQAAEELLEKGHIPKRTIYLAFGHDEELSGAEGAQRIAEHLKKQNVELEFVMDEGLFILDGQIPGVDKPIAFIGVAEKGYLDLEMTVKSAGGHSSQPPSETGAGILSRAIVKLENYRFPAKLKGVVDAMFDYTSPEMRGIFKIIFSNRWLFSPIIISQLEGSATTNALIRTTSVTTMLSGSQKPNVMPPFVKAITNFRILPGETLEGTIAKVKEIIDDPRVELKALDGANEPVPQSDLSGEGFRLLKDSIKEVFPDVVVAPSLMIGGTDSKRFADLTKNIYRFSPMHLSDEDLAGFHGTNERLKTENLKMIVVFYINLFNKLG